MNSNDYLFIENQIDYNFKNKDLLHQAFTRRSYSKENGGEDNEVLEFIGDKVLDLVVVKWLSDKFGYFFKNTNDYRYGDLNEYCSNYNEHEFTSFKKKLVCRETLSSRIDIMNLSDFLIMGKGDVRNKVNEKDSVKEDLFEAILGAIALDTNWNIQILEKSVDIMLAPAIILNNKTEDYYELVQDWYEERLQFNYTYYYGFSGEYGCNFSMEFTQESNNGRCYTERRSFSGRGNSKSLARNAACKAAYKYLEQNDLLWTILDEIDEPNEEQAINQLEILSQKGYFSRPEYVFRDDEEYDNNGHRIWTCECHVDEAEYYYYGSASTKKAAKKKAAFSMLEYVLENF